MPLHFSNKKGDLYITFEVLFRTTLKEDQKTRIKEVLGNDTLSKCVFSGKCFHLGSYAFPL